MASNLPSFETRPPKQSRPINIVPLHVPNQINPAATSAQFVYNNGPLLTSAHVFTIFWGTAWDQSPLNATIQSINDFFDYILTSPLIDQLAEYSVQGKTIGHGSRTGTITLTTPEPGTSVDDSAIRQMLNTNIANNSAFPQPTANTLYFVYLPSGVTVTPVAQAPARHFVAITTPSTARSTTPSCPTPIAQVAPVTLQHSMHSPRPVRTSSANRSPTRFPARAGTTRTTVKLATSAPGRRRRWETTPCKRSGRTAQIAACNTETT